jgi:hypothetical protein
VYTKREDNERHSRGRACMQRLVTAVIEKASRTAVSLSPPLQPKSRPRWVPDAEADVCTACKSMFTMVNRRVSGQAVLLDAVTELHIH